jgi:hypothetical protein
LNWLNGLLELAVEAHGGLSRWRELTSITARLSLGGLVLTTTGWEGVFQDVAITIDTRAERAYLAPFTGPDRRGIFTPERVAIETDRGELLHERFDPRLGFNAHTIGVAWGALQVAYFIGCSLWTALTVPFLLTQPGFQTEELEPWAEEGETWRRLRAVFPAGIDTHKPDQVFYFGSDGLLRRHDYDMEFARNIATADYTDEHQVFGGISFPTLRRAVGREPDGTTVPDPAFITVDIEHVSVESVV